MNREHWKQVLKINAGWSSDKKYHVFDDARDYLLRISDASTFEEKKQEAQISIVFMTCICQCQMSMK